MLKDLRYLPTPQCGLGTNVKIMLFSKCVTYKILVTFFLTECPKKTGDFWMISEVYCD